MLAKDLRWPGRKNGRLVARDRERAAIDQFVDNIRRGPGGVLVVRGEPGIGKTALVGQALAAAPDVRQLRVVGREFEVAPRSVTPADLAGGYMLPDRVPVSGVIEESFIVCYHSVFSTLNMRISRQCLSGRRVTGSSLEDRVRNDSDWKVGGWGRQCPKRFQLGTRSCPVRSLLTGTATRAYCEWSESLSLRLRRVRSSSALSPPLSTRGRSGFGKALSRRCGPHPSPKDKATISPVGSSRSVEGSRRLW